MDRIKFGFTAEQIVKEGRVRDEEIDLIQTWVQTQKMPKLTFEQIVLFLLSCLNEQEATKKTIQAFYFVRNGYPELFDNRAIEVDEMQKQLEALRFCAFPERTNDDYAIIFLNFHNSDYSKFDMRLTMKILFMTLDAAIYDHPPQGLIIMVDMGGMGLMHLTKLKPGLIKAFFQYLQEGLPVKLKHMHLLNCSYIVDRLFAIIKPFIAKEVMEMVSQLLHKIIRPSKASCDGKLCESTPLPMIHFHPKSLDMEQFYKIWIPTRCLPKDLGGDLPSIEVLHENNIEKLTKMQLHFDAEELQRHSLN